MVNEYFMPSFDGKKIFVREWTVDDPVGVVQIFHGMAEHCGRYDAFAKYLNSLGFMVVADDHRAHGRTDEETLGYCDGDIWEDTLKDLLLINKTYRGRYQDKKYVIFAHSYGSFLAQRYVQLNDGLNQRLFDGVILCGSSKMDGLPVMAGHIFAKNGKPDKPAEFIKKMSFDAYNKKCKEGTFVSSIVAECERYSADKYCDFVCSNNFYKGFFNGLKQLYKKENLSKVNADLPLLIISGDKDPVGDYGRGVKRLCKMYEQLGLKKVKMHLLPDNRHEILNDTGKEEALKIIADFIKEI